MFAAIDRQVITAASVDAPQSCESMKMFARPPFCQSQSGHSGPRKPVFKTFYEGGLTIRRRNSHHSLDRVWLLQVRGVFGGDRWLGLGLKRP